MPAQDLGEPTLGDMFARSVKTGRLFQGELLGLARRAAEQPPRPPPAGVPPLPGLLLRLDRVAPGDVLLSRGDGLESDAIAAFSGGKFSHAALWIDPLTTLESNGGLIGPQRARCFGSAKLDGEQIVLGEIVGAPAACEVYRHDGMNSVSIERFADALQAEMHESYGKDYSEYYRLVTLARLPASPALAKYLVPFAAEVTRAWEHRYSRDKVYGPFCSELVARFFQHLGLTLFDEDRAPQLTSPNDLAGSALQRVAGAVVDSSRLQDIRYDGPATEDVYFGLQGTLMEMRRKQRGTEQAVDQLMATSQRFEERRRQHFTEMESIFRIEFEAVLDIVRMSADLGAPYLVRRALRLAEQCTRVAPPLFATWGSEFSDAKDLQQDSKDWEQASNNWLQFGRSVVRCRMLLKAWQLKREDGGINKLSQTFYRFQHQRRRKWLLKQIRAYRSANPPTPMRMSATGSH